MDRISTGADNIPIKEEPFQREWVAATDNEKLRLLYNYMDGNQDGLISKVHSHKFKTL